MVELTVEPDVGSGISGQGRRRADEITAFPRKCLRGEFTSGIFRRAVGRGLRLVRHRAERLDRPRSGDREATALRLCRHCDRAGGQARGRINERRAGGGYNLDVRISERPAAAKRPPRPASAPRRPPPRIAPRASAESVADEDDASFAPRPRVQPRRQPAFQVERRSLPRRPG